MTREEVKNYDTIEPLKTRKDALRRYMSPQINSKEEADKILSLKGDETILDAGCGFGELLSYLCGKYPEAKLYGIDVSKAMIEEAQNNQSEINYSVQNIEHMSFDSGMFDVVIAKHMLYHVDDIPKAISEVYRVLKPDGKFLITLHSTQKGSRNNIESYKDFLGNELNRKSVQTISRINAENYSQYVKKDEFEEIDKKVLFSSGDIKSAEPFIKYMGMFREFFIPAPPKEDWEAALKKLSLKLNQEIMEKGHIKETYGMGFILLKKKHREV